MANFRPEPFGNQFANAILALPSELRGADDAEREEVHLFLHDLQLGDARNQHGEIFGQRDSGNPFSFGRDDVIGDAAFDGDNSGNVRPQEHGLSAQAAASPTR